MSVEIVMPKLSDTMEEGTILKWLKNVGDEVTSGEPIAEVETDKADMELEAAESGVLREIKVPAGESAAVGAVLALVDAQASGARNSAGQRDTKRGEEPGRDDDRGTARAATVDDATESARDAERGDESGNAGDEDAAPRSRDREDSQDAAPPSHRDGDGARRTTEQSTPPRGTAPRPRRDAGRGGREGAEGTTSAGAVRAESSARDEPRPEVKTSPAARKIAAERGIDLRTVRGSGPDGRVVKQDVQGDAADDGDRGGRGADDAPARERDDQTRGRDRSDAARPRAETRGDADRSEAPARAPTHGASAPVASERQELSRMRQSIARRMAEAFRDIPHFYVTAAIDMTEAVRLKQAIEASELTTAPITYTHLILKATALALKRHPRLNASYRDGAIEVKGEVNIGLVVAVDDGLIVPILRHVDELSLEEISTEARRLAELAKRGRFASEDLSGGTFTVSNMGMLDIEEFAAVINPPQAAILAVGAIKERAIVRAGAVVAARTMRVTLSCDHRIIDGVVGGRFLEELKRLLENPITLVMRERHPR